MESVLGPSNPSLSYSNSEGSQDRMVIFQGGWPQSIQGQLWGQSPNCFLGIIAVSPLCVTSTPTLG